VEGEQEQLRRDREALKRELARLKGQQEAALLDMEMQEAALLDMERRVRRTERRQEQCKAFLGRALRSPGFLDSLARRSGLASGEAAPVVEGEKKRRLLDAIPSPPPEDSFTFEEELALAAGGVVDPDSQSADGVTTDKIWYELFGEEHVSDHNPDA
jgi:heat shock transcription factor